ncbi:cytidine deaminase [Metamycoplasma alkalescens]|uniref:Cytidine deaminase n=2 Tax=Metamycoplasma alkalescens TaxID=45363 RepID=N9UBH9_9BACT|nr:cytidine deaminase [Metamycoplasma alkalescens]ENY54081.1 Cytidine deaminase [Metamycoplasma alkalescens 14918]PYF43597.1 cytidine deaminase [Metamycoplasma alkalescens]SYV89888.1 Cytidine deaminase [Metamycoplasma alkalescens]
MELKEKEILRKKLDYAYAPYSKVKVAALAIDAKCNKFYGVNCENAAYPSGLCAERAALFSSVVHGIEMGTFKEIHIISNLNKILYPCGACRQVMSQFLENDAKIILHSTDFLEEKVFTMEEMLPGGVKSEDIIAK